VPEIDRGRFFAAIRNLLWSGVPLTAGQVEGHTVLLDEWERRHSEDDRRWLAYALATAYHETGRTMQPIEEWGIGAGKPYGEPDIVTGKRYYGRGYVQLTWRENYDRAGRHVGVDLVAEPERALESEIAARVLFEGMIVGLFTGKRLVDYFAADREDWRGARRIVNGLDRATRIGRYGRAYFEALGGTAP
jgi:hypothetical protein